MSLSYSQHLTKTFCSNNNHSSSQMQGMDRKYNGHTWSKVITTNIKNTFGLNLKKFQCLGHLHYDYNCFIHFNVHNETVWILKSAHIPVKKQIVLGPFTTSLGCKFCNSLPFCVNDYKGQIFYVVHKLYSISKPTIHLGVHLHPIGDIKYKKTMEETKMLIEEEVNQTLDMKTSTISLSAIKYFFA